MDYNRLERCNNLAKAIKELSEEIDKIEKYEVLRLHERKKEDYITLCLTFSKPLTAEALKIDDIWKKAINDVLKIKKAELKSLQIEFGKL